AEPDTQVRLFGKPEVMGCRRMGVVLARANSVDDALQRAKQASKQVEIQL
ncbi:MAG: phosphoribosylglycinamide formyltransferase 2, partial [Gammaproteobacteria bacterium]|nr:phosphoribosylglycinamide formyltransferase 2 [Gammaproteobacteria bacterium]